MYVSPMHRKGAGSGHPGSLGDRGGGDVDRRVWPAQTPGGDPTGQGSQAQETTTPMRVMVRVMATDLDDTTKKQQHYDDESMMMTKVAI